jgi:Cu/Ag efflux pump CusA
LQFQLQTLLEGNVIGSILELDKAVPIRMIYPNTQNRNLEEKKDFYLLPNGKSIPITNLVTISISKGIAEIREKICK